MNKIQSVYNITARYVNIKQLLGTLLSEQLSYSCVLIAKKKETPTPPFQQNILH